MKSRMILILSNGCKEIDLILNKYGQDFYNYLSALNYDLYLEWSLFWEIMNFKSIVNKHVREKF